VLDIYIWPERDISISLAYIGTAGRGAVGSLLMCLSVSSKQNGGATESFSKFEVRAVLSFLQEKGVSESGIPLRFESPGRFQPKGNVSVVQQI
jgi:hypothetical protein